MLADVLANLLDLCLVALVAIGPVLFICSFYHSFVAWRYLREDKQHLRYNRPAYWDPKNFTASGNCHRRMAARALFLFFLWLLIIITVLVGLAEHAVPPSP